MRDVENINDIISELEQINGWFCGINDIDNAIEELPFKKKKEIDDTNSKYKTVDSINNLVDKLPQMKTVIDASLEDFAPLFPPKHWQDTNADDDKEVENAIENWLSYESKDKIYNAFREYDKVFLSVAEECDAEYNKAKAIKASKLDEIEREYNKKKEELVAQKKHFQHQLDGTTLIPEELFEDADRILNMLKLKRADTLKEAINLALDEKRKDEEEAERRKEAARREAILEEQAWDNRMHNEAMQRAAEEEARAMRERNAAVREHNAAMREHNAAMERAAKDQASAAEAQAREAQKQTQMAKRQADDALRAARARCGGCANYVKCTARYHEGAIGCPAYIPR